MFNISYFVIVLLMLCVGFCINFVPRIGKISAADARLVAARRSRSFSAVSL